MKTTLYGLDGTERFTVDVKGDAPRRMGKAVETALKYNQSLKELDLQGADFKGRQIKGAVFDGSDMAGCDFTGCDVSATWFNSCNLEGALFNGATARFSSFLGADIRGAEMVGNFEHAQIDHDELSYAQIEEMKVHQRTNRYR